LRATRPTLTAGALASALLLVGCSSGTAEDSTGATVDGTSPSTSAEGDTVEQVDRLPAGSMLWSSLADYTVPSNGAGHPEGVIVSRLETSDDVEQFTLHTPDAAPVLIDTSAVFADVERVYPAGGTVVLVEGTADGESGLYGFDTSTGKVSYTVDVPGDGSLRAVVSGDAVLAGRGDTGPFQAFSLKDGATLGWSAPADVGPSSLSSRNGEDYFGFSGSGGTRYVDSGTGRPVDGPPQVTIDGDSATVTSAEGTWTATGLPPGPRAYDFVQFGRMVFVGGQYDTVFTVVEAATGELVHTLNVLDSVPGLDDCDSEGLLNASTLLVNCDRPGEDDDGPVSLFAFALEPVDVEISTD
jgi:hypothetical protein